MNKEERDRLNEAAAVLCDFCGDVNCNSCIVEQLLFDAEAMCQKEIEKEDYEDD